MDQMTKALCQHLKSLKKPQRESHILTHLAALDFARSEALSALPMPHNRTANQIRAFHILWQQADIEMQHAEAIQKLQGLESEVMRQFKARELEEQRTKKLRDLPHLPTLDRQEQRDVMIELRRYAVQSQVEEAVKALQEILVA